MRAHNLPVVSTTSTLSIDTNGWVIIVRGTLYETTGAVRCRSVKPEPANVDVVYMKLRNFTGHRSHFDLPVPYA